MVLHLSRRDRVQKSRSGSIASARARAEDLVGKVTRPWSPWLALAATALGGPIASSHRVPILGDRLYSATASLS